VNNMESFINFVNELVDDEFDNYLGGVKAKYYFLNKGCLEFVKIIMAYFPSVTIVSNRKIDHLAIKYNNLIYDASGKISGIDFEEITKQEFDILQDFLGIPEVRFEHNQVSKAVIDELNMCSGDFVKILVEKIKKDKE